MKNCNTSWHRIVTGALATLAISGTAFGQSADSLIDKLVDKGILTVKEANELREQADQDFNRVYSVKSGMPDWVTALKINGDFRARFDNIFIPNKQLAPGVAASTDRMRFRYRLRAGITAVLHDNFEVGLRLTSAEPYGAFGGDPISGNASYKDNGSKKFVFLDLAYAKWTALNNPDWKLELAVGKMENPLVFSDLVFDGDYTPEGYSLQLTRHLNEKHSLGFTAGFFPLDEITAAAHDPMLLAGQLRLDSHWSEKISSSLGLAGLLLGGSDNLGNGAVANVRGGNTRDAAGNLVHDFTPLVADASFTYLLDKFPLHDGPFPIKVMGDYLHNFSVGNRNIGWSAGFQLGKAGKRGSWQIGYNYKQLEADAWYEEFGDSDTGAFYGAIPASWAAGAASGYVPGTNLRGHVIRLAYSPFDSTTITASYYHFDTIKDYPSLAPASKNDGLAGRLIVDIMWKF